MSRAHGQVRSGQVITTYGPGALIDLPRDSGIVGGLDSWPKPSDLTEITEPRLSRKLELMTEVKAPRLYTPPPAPDDPRQPNVGISVWRFPEWFVVQEETAKADPARRERSRRIVHRKALDEKRRFDGRQVVATRFVRACPKGHVDDLDWRGFVHGPEDNCRRQLWLDERGTSGDLAELFVRCECKKTRPMYEASEIELNALGFCTGRRPWLGAHASEDCKEHSRLLVRTASNAYFPQVVSVLSLPDRGSDVERVARELWDDLQIVDDAADLGFLKKKPRVAEKLAPFSDQQVLEAIQNIKGGGAAERPVKEVELDAILAASEGYGDDVPIDPDFHVRRLPDAAWRKGKGLEAVQAVFQLHRLREVLALAGFSRFEAVMPDINGEYDTDVERAAIQVEPTWFPAVENRGEGIFVQLRPSEVSAWLERPGVLARLSALAAGHASWAQQRKSDRLFPGGPYMLLHTLSHLLIQALSMRAGYSASSIRERIYSDFGSGRYGMLLFTGSSDAEGTLGGLVGEGRHMYEHLNEALGMAALCSNDPICAQHSPDDNMEQRWLHGAACHGCSLIAETSCEMRNEYLDRALVVPVLGVTEAAFFGDA
ncbi:MAG: DUF1998 domain-containing protein [Actinomycetota bacterium]